MSNTLKNLFQDKQMMQGALASLAKTSEELSLKRNARATEDLNLRFEGSFCISVGIVLTIISAIFFPPHLLIMCIVAALAAISGGSLLLTFASATNPYDADVSLNTELIIETCEHVKQYDEEIAAYIEQHPDSVMSPENADADADEVSCVAKEKEGVDVEPNVGESRFALFAVAPGAPTDVTVKPSNAYQSILN